MAQFLQEHFGIPKREAAAAVKAAYEAYDAYAADLCGEKGAEYIDQARANGQPHPRGWQAGPTTWTRRSTTASTT